MRFRPAFLMTITAALFLTALFAQRGFKTYPYEETNPVEVPAGSDEKTEWTFARLRYPSGRYGGYWGRGSWGIDFPKADRQFVKGVKRLTRLHARSAEQVVDLDLDDDEIYYWPWVYAVEVGHWDLTDAQCKKLRDYLLRGGFLMVDDFHGTFEWEIFLNGMKRIFPDRPVVDIPAKDAIFHVLYDLDEKIQVMGTVTFGTGRTYEYDGVVPEWKGVYDDRGRVMVGICHNQDNGDAWEWADSPRYPEKAASQAFRLGINYIIYAMTH